MNAKPTSLRLLKLLLALWWWGLILGAVATLSYVAMNDEVELALWGYASNIDTSTLEAVDRQGQQLAVKFDGPARVKLVLPSETGKPNFGVGHKVIGVLIILPYYLTSIYIVKQLRDIVQTIDVQNPFAKENAARIRVVGILIFVFQAIETGGRLAMSGFADSMVVPTGFNLNGRIEFNEGLLFVGMAMIVLSEVFRHGSRLREEQSLTV